MQQALDIRLTIGNTFLLLNIGDVQPVHMCICGVRDAHGVRCMCGMSGMRGVRGMSGGAWWCMV